MIDILKSGGVLMIPIIICAVIATFIVIERCIYFKVVKDKDLKLTTVIQPFIQARDFAKINDACTEADTPTAAVIKKAVESRILTLEAANEAVDAEASLQMPKFEKFLTPLGTIANISTLLGLLGTVTGNIKAFGVLGSGGSMGNPAVLAGSIAEALVTTAAGLVVSIPAVIFHNFFISRENHAVLRMESVATKVQLGLRMRPTTTASVTSTTTATSTGTTTSTTPVTNASKSSTASGAEQQSGQKS